MDSSFVKKKEKKKFSEYENIASNSVFSAYRYDYLIKTINLLNNYGDVYLVQLPVHPEMLKIEKNYLSDFNEKINLAKQLSRAYLNMNEMPLQNYSYTDGNHRHKYFQELCRQKLEIGSQIVIRLKRRKLS